MNKEEAQVGGLVPHEPIKAVVVPVDCFERVCLHYVFYIIIIPVACNHLKMTII